MGQYTGVNTAGNVVALPQAIMEVYSADILFEAQGIMRFEEFAVKKTELTKQPGESITMTKYNNLERGGKLNEDETMTERQMSASQASITVDEFGNAIGVTEKLLQMNMDDTLANGAKLLGRDYAVVNDLMCRDAVCGGSQIVYAGDKTSMAALDGDVDYFDIEVIRKGVEILQTKEAPKFNGEFYVCFITPHQAAYIKRDPDWVAANNYANTRRLFTGEIGTWEDVVFISTTHCRNGATNVKNPGYEATFKGAATGGSTPADVYEGLLFSDSAFGKATALPPEMRDSGVQDYGRRHGLAWYSIMGAAILEDDFIVRIKSV